MSAPANESAACPVFTDDQLARLRSCGAARPVHQYLAQFCGREPAGDPAPSQPAPIQPA